MARRAQLPQVCVRAETGRGRRTCGGDPAGPPAGSPKTVRFTATMPLIVAMSERSTRGTMVGMTGRLAAAQPRRRQVARDDGSMPRCARALSSVSDVTAVARRAPDGVGTVRIAQAGHAAMADEAALGPAHHAPAAERAAWRGRRASARTSTRARRCPRRTATSVPTPSSRRASTRRRRTSPRTPRPARAGRS